MTSLNVSGLFFYREVLPRRFTPRRNSRDSKKEWTLSSLDYVQVPRTGYLRPTEVLPLDVPVRVQKIRRINPGPSEVSTGVELVGSISLSSGNRVETQFMDLRQEGLGCDINGRD